MPKQKRNWIVDAGLFIGFLLTFFLDLTGLVWHQWLGVAIGVLALYHLVVHWDWVVSVTKRFFRRTSKQYRLNYIIDWNLLISYSIIGISGFIISTWFAFDLSNYLLWRDIHIYSSIIALIISVLKIGTHWKWIVKTASKYFGLWRQPIPIPAVQSIRVNPRTNSMDRREFIQLMGVASLASLFSAANLLEFGEDTSREIVTNQTISQEIPEVNTVINNTQDCTVICDQGCPYPGQCRRYIDQDGNGICDLTECSDTTESIYLESEEVIIQDKSELSPTASLQEEGECLVVCSQACSYPGECKDYVDTNGNNLCDLGECLVSNLSAEPLTSSRGGGKQRRGNH